MIKFEGVYSVLPTPFHPDGQIDLESLGKAVDLFVGAGVNGLTCLGVTSETTKLNESERDLILDCVLKKNAGRVPVVVGTTSPATRLSIEYSRRAKSAGGSAVMISPPRMNKLNSDAVVRHYREVSDAVDLPIVIQDYPPVSGYNMEASLLVRIAREVPAACAIKLEDPPTPYKTARIMELAEGMDLSIFGGLGGMYLMEELLAGATGAMTGFAYPEILLEIISHYRSGKIEDAAALFYRTVSLMRFEFQEGIGMAIRKEMLRRRGVFVNCEMRSPSPRLDAVTSLALDNLLAWMKKEKLPWF